MTESKKSIPDRHGILFPSLLFHRLRILLPNLWSNLSEVGIIYDEVKHLKFTSSKTGKKEKIFFKYCKAAMKQSAVKKWCNTEVNMTWMKLVASIRFISMYFKKLSFMISRLISSVCSILIWILFIFLNLLGLFIFRVLYIYI